MKKRKQFLSFVLHFPKFVFSSLLLSPLSILLFKISQICSIQIIILFNLWRFAFFSYFSSFFILLFKKDFCESNGASLPSLLSLPFKLVLVYERYLEKLLEIDSLLPNQKQRNQQRNVYYPKVMNTLQTVSTVSHKLRALAEFLSWEEKIERMERTILLLPV